MQHTVSEQSKYSSDRDGNSRTRSTMLCLVCAAQCGDAQLIFIVHSHLSPPFAQTVRAHTHTLMPQGN